MQGGKTVAEYEPEELVQFRKQWLEEVRSKKQGQSSQDRAGRPSASTEKQKRPQVQSPSAHRSPERHAPHASPSLNMIEREGASFGPVLQRAVEFYRSAVEHEQRSELDLALQLYRAAFRLDSNVHLAYQLVEDAHQRKAAVAGTTNVVHHKKTPSTTNAMNELVHGIRDLEIGAPVSAGTVPRGLVVTGSLGNLIASWPMDLSFESPKSEGEGGEEREEKSDEGNQTTMKSLSDELLLMILRLLDYHALERFASVSRKARVITLEGSLWRVMVEALYRPPQIREEEDYEALMEKYKSDYRRIYVEHPRVRYDGVYIAMCHYVRNGLGDNAWVNYTQTVTYYRYLRFYPDGEVLSLLANEDLAPAHVVPMLKPSLRLKGFSIGTWYLDGKTVHIGNLLEPGADEARYSFQMVLDLRTRPLGRWNRLDFRTYDSVHLGSGEAIPLPLRHERSFWFSKVTSYVV